MERAFIPNSAPWITEREIAAVTDLLRSGRIGSTTDALRAARESLKQFTGGREVLLTPSCTLALELALRCLEPGPEDEVILPSYTFVSTANAVLQCGAKPVLTDIEDRTFSLDLEQVEAATGHRTRAVIPVHYAGISCDMDRLLAQASRAGVAVIEDAAHAFGARYKGRFLGALGDFGCFSFHDTKNYVCGEGGALVIGNDAYRHKAECVYEKGTNRMAFLRGEIDKYTWVCQGGSYVLSAVLAALLRVQVERFEDILEGRRAVVRRYREGLASLVGEGEIRFGDVPAYATPNEHIAFFLVRDHVRRDPLLAHLKEQGIGAVFHYVPLHLSPFARERLGTKPGQFPVTERVADTIVRLPLFPQMTEEQCDRVIDAVKSFFHPAHIPVSRPAAAVQGGAQGEQVDLTLVVPCYNEEGHLHQSLDEVMRILRRLSLRYEVLLIDDCSRDGTADRIREYVALHPSLPLRAVFHGKNAGRGATVTEGVRLARGRFVGFLDIDLEVHAKYLPSTILRLLQGEADMVLAERSYKMHLFVLPRLITTGGYKLLVRMMLGTPPLDTEAGYKFFRRDAILPVLECTRDPHWFWDTEVTVRAHDAGLRIRHEQVLFTRKKEKKSTVRFPRDIWRSFIALLRFRRQRRRERRVVIAPVSGAVSVPSVSHAKEKERAFRP
ncbi:MAG: dTDP-4-amino-4,6-dideoxygalactose transaminase [Candidatus Peribacteraceae bacterium]|nr:dTDP-4-amino-4,6-dideoxygalactose transaminase [Candidatus Peribacteraceae bacterium]